MKCQTDYFQLQGQLIAFVIKPSGKVKYLRIQHNQQEYWLKPEKTELDSLDRILTPGCWLGVTGERKIDRKSREVKLKALQIQAIAPPNFPLSPPQVFAEDPLQHKCQSNKRQSKTKSKPARILVCQKSSCRKKGAGAVSAQLESNLQKHGLAEQVEVKAVGCLKECKKGPNLVILPDKVNYSRVRPREVSTLVERHFKAVSTTN